MVADIYSYREFINLAHSFFIIIIYPALLDCLLINTFLGNLYNYINSNNGTRVIPFFKRLSINLVEAYFKSFKLSLVITSAATLNAILTVIYKMLKKVPRAIFYKIFLNLVNSLENIPEVININNKSTIFQIIINRITELRAIITRANSLFNHEKSRIDSVSIIIVIFIYPREIILPGDHHDNNKINIIKVKILPTEDEI